MFPLLFQSYWRDEAFSVLMAQRPFVEIIRLSAHDFSPPLYFILLRIWITLFGASEAATRSLSVLFYILTLTTIVLFLRKFTKMNIGIISVLVLVMGSLHPLMTSYAFETRMYTMAAWLATLSWYFLLRKRWGWYAVVTLVGLYTHYFILLIIGVQMAYLLMSHFPERRPLIRFVKNNYVSILLFFAPLVLFIPWLVLFISAHHFGTSVPFWVPKPTFTNLITIPSLITLGHDTFSNFKFDVRPFSFLIYGLILLAYVQKSKSENRILFPLLLWTLLPGIIVWILSQFTTSLFLPRYLIVSSPALMILVIMCLDGLRPVSKVIIAVIIALLMWNFMSMSSRFAQTRQIFVPTKENLRSYIEKIKAEANPSDYLIVESELDYHVAQVYWFDALHVKIIGKTYQEIPDYVGKILIPESAVLKKPYPKIEGYILRKDRKVTVFK